MKVLIDGFPFQCEVLALQQWHSILKKLSCALVVNTLSRCGEIASQLEAALILKNMETCHISVPRVKGQRLFSI